MTRFVGIDPSTLTGVCILDESGNVIDVFESTNKEKDPERMLGIINDVMNSIETGDVLAIEGFGFASTSGFILGGIGWGIRMNLFNQQQPYFEVAPSALKKFASGKGTTKKDVLAVHIYKHWGFEHESDNVRDAFVLAQIARAIRMGTSTTKYQQDVVAAILALPKSKKKVKS